MFYFMPALPEGENCFGAWFYSKYHSTGENRVSSPNGINFKQLLGSGWAFVATFPYCFVVLSDQNKYKYCASDTGSLSPYVLSPHVSENSFHRLVYHLWILKLFCLPLHRDH